MSQRDVEVVSLAVWCETGEIMFQKFKRVEASKTSRHVIRGDGVERGSDPMIGGGS